MSWALYIINLKINILLRFLIPIKEPSTCLDLSWCPFIIMYLDIVEDTIGIVGPHLPTRCVRDILIPMSLDTLKDTNFRFRFCFKIEIIIYPTRKICLTLFNNLYVYALLHSVNTPPFRNDNGMSRTSQDFP